MVQCNVNGRAFGFSVSCVGGWVCCMCVGVGVCGWMVRGCVAAWVRGCVGVWVHGSVGVWVCECVGCMGV